ncbi:hypothetical protein LZQ00_09625 [Sphingobacterium sp. SRCM116780]|uniref:hypothetical protein n=1 Tax=Sphingobacterium sp. SRCM116780 TaxID=2907623 RepID=UPI001F19E135|nr:hypothetical protein [Sphingobacterium sp. SRCM116780]UIR54531.1 hypothetical protein LZQ00_09625 [Sphingobacterium sp. SRCM116780]
MTNLTIQYTIVAVIIIAAILYFAKSMRASFAGKKSCGKGCECDVDQSIKIHQKSDS